MNCCPTSRPAVGTPEIFLCQGLGADEVLPGRNAKSRVTRSAGVERVATVASDEECQRKANDSKIEQEREWPPEIVEGCEEDRCNDQDDEKRIQGRIKLEWFHFLRSVAVVLSKYESEYQDARR
jgi:hypothetical protein